MSNTLFQPGDTVWCVLYGKGLVKRIEDAGEYPVIVEAPNGTEIRYTMCGRERTWFNRTLFFSEPTIVAQETKFRSTLKKHEDLVLVKKLNGMKVHIYVLDEGEGWIEGRIYGDAKTWTFKKDDYHVHRVDPARMKF